MATTYYIKRGDLARAFSDTLKIGSTAVDLTGATLTFVLRNAATGEVKVNAAATIVSAAAGTVKYTPTGTDTDTVGIYDAEWKVTFADSTVLRFPSTGYIRIEIVEDLE